MDLRKGYTDDIDWSDIWPKSLVTFLITAILVFLVCCGYKTDHKEKYEKSLAYNEYAESYNALDEPTREKIIPLLTHQPEEGKNTLEIIENPPNDLTDAEKKGFTIAFLACLVFASIAGFVGYANTISYRYFVADLPYKKPYGIFLFFFFFGAWPAILISAIHMLIVHLREQRKENEAITAEVEEAFDQGDMIAEIKQSIKPGARKAFVKYSTRYRMRSFKSRQSEAEERLQNAKRHVERATTELKNARKGLSDATANLRAITESFPDANSTKEDALSDFDKIAAMRGVRNIRVSNGKHPKIVVDVRVQYLYKETLYDFGDYCITIEDGNYTCRRTRSGVKLNPTNTSPDYNESRGFCFGSRRETIGRYVRGYRIAEALTLMIDSLHSVNDDHAESMIPECFRRVKTIQAAEERLRQKGGVKK